MHMKGWAGLGWAGLGWAGLGWAGLGCAVPCCAVLCCAVLCLAVLCCVVLPLAEKAHDGVEGCTQCIKGSQPRHTPYTQIYSCALLVALEI